MKHKLYFLLFLFLSLPVWMHAQVPPLPMDPQILYGRLDNGLTYYIRKNAQPEQRANFYLVQGTGSLQEEERQRGLAHVIEHMAFNGSLHFPGQGIDRYLEGIGLKSGDNLNAYTAFDETVYLLMDVPTSRSGIIDSSLLILRDISSDLLLEDDAIEKERAVIREEWRTGRDAESRIQELQFPVLLAGSKYASRLPIGSIEVINVFRPDELRDYYKRWYRPDLQAVIVVGDVDTAYVKEKLTDLFAGIPCPSSPHNREKAIVPIREEPAVTIAKDKEASGYIVNLFYKYERLPDDLAASLEGVRKDYLQSVVSSLLNDRLELMLYEPDPPFVFAQSTDGDYLGTRTCSAWSIAAIAEEGKMDSALLILSREAERVKRFGFTAQEYERVKANVLKYYENLYLERETEENSVYADACITHFTWGGYLPGIEMEFDLINQIAEEVTLDEVNGYAEAILKSRDVVIALSGPDKVGPGFYLDEVTALKLFNSMNTCELEPYQETAPSAPLISEYPLPGEILKEEADSLFQATVLTLSNGVRVVAKPTAFRDDEVVITGTSPGGNTLFADTDRTGNLKVLGDVVDLGGLNDFSAIELNRLLAGKYVSCSSTIDENSESIGGYSSSSDLRTLFELIYLYFTAPRMDEAAFLSYQARSQARLINLERNPMVAFSDSLTVALNGDSPEMRRITGDEIERLDYPHIMDMYKDRFQDASDFVFTVVGRFDMDSVRSFAKAYLATLPVLHRIESGREEALVPLRRGVVKKHFRKPMETPKSSVVHYFHGNAEYTLKNVLAANMLTQWLDQIYMEKVRNQEGGSYGVSSLARIYSFPKGNTSLQIYFDTDPDREEQMNHLVLSELMNLAVTPPDKADFLKVKENLMKTYQENQTSNIYWLSLIDNYYFSSFDSYSNYLETLESITPEYIRDFTQQLLSSGNHIEVIMSPE